MGTPPLEEAYWTCRMRNAVLEGMRIVCGRMVVVVVGDECSAAQRSAAQRIAALPRRGKVWWRLPDDETLLSRGEGPGLAWQGTMGDGDAGCHCRFTRPRRVFGPLCGGFEMVFDTYQA